MSLRSYQAILVVTFCMLLCVPGAFMLLRPEVPKLYGVKPVPYPSYTSFDKWPGDFEQYFAANLGRKRDMVSLHNWIGYRLIGDLQSDNVLVGKHGWLYLKQNFGWESLRSEEPLSAKDAATWRRSLRAVRDLLTERHVPFLFVIVPSKETIYPEHLPASAERARDKSRLDEMRDVFAGSGIEYLDLSGPLREARTRAQLYDSVDSHWNGNGARIGAELILARAAKLLQRPDAWAALDSRLSPRPSWADMPLILSLEDRVTVPSVELLPNQARAQRVEPPARVLEPNRKQQTKMVWELEAAALPRALILRDSFAEGFMPTLNEKFQRTAWLWTHELDLRLVDREKPDIVIVEMTERFFSDAPPKLMKPRSKP